jgi:hypothetical protein
VDVVPYFTSLGHPCAEHVNPADHVISIVNVDFIQDAVEAGKRIDNLVKAWVRSQASLDTAYGKSEMALDEKMDGGGGKGGWLRVAVKNTWVLMEKNALNYRRNLLAYGVRLGMYREPLLTSYVWVHKIKHFFGSRDGYPPCDCLGQFGTGRQQNCASFSCFEISLTSLHMQNDRLSVHFFSVAFLGFMSVAGIPSFLEERQVFVRERFNGLYGPGPYVIVNSIVTLPFLAMCTGAGVFCVIWQVFFLSLARVVPMR